MSDFQVPVCPNRIPTWNPPRSRVVCPVCRAEFEPGEVKDGRLPEHAAQPNDLPVAVPVPKSPDELQKNWF